MVKGEVGQDFGQSYANFVVNGGIVDEEGLFPTRQQCSVALWRILQSMNAEMPQEKETQQTKQPTNEQLSQDGSYPRPDTSQKVYFPCVRFMELYYWLGF